MTKLLPWVIEDARYSLVDVDCINIPSLVRPFTNIEVNNVSMPVDMVSLLDSIPSAEMVVYNQMLFIPNQKKELSLLEKKKTAMQVCPIQATRLPWRTLKMYRMLSQEKTNSWYIPISILSLEYPSIRIFSDVPIIWRISSASWESTSASNRTISWSFLSIHSPGNCYSTNPEYDRFLTLSDAATCLMYKERIQHSEETPLKIYYTDRQGVPVAIDISGKEGKNKITDNSNFFCLGPSGSGKKFPHEQRGTSDVGAEH